MGLSFANKVTICRILAVPVFILALAYSSQRQYFREIAIGVFLLAVISDVVDGYIARRWYQKTTAGAILDPLADKLLLISAFVCLFILGKTFGEVYFPLWFVLIVISRDVILLVGSLIIYQVHGQLEISPTKWGKTTAFFQILCILGVLFQIEISQVVWYLTVVLTFISGVGYLRKGIKVLNASSR